MILDLDENSLWLIVKTIFLTVSFKIVMVMIPKITTKAT